MIAAAPSPNVRAAKRPPSEADTIACLHALQDGNYPQAVQLGGSAYRDHALKVVQLIFEKEPPVLPGISEPVLAALKICAAYMEIFDDARLPDCIQIQGNWKARLTPTATALQIRSAAQHALRLKNVHQHGVKYIKVVANDHKAICPSCAGDVGKRYLVGQIPELPHQDCTCAPEVGCGCMVVADE